MRASECSTLTMTPFFCAEAPRGWWRLCVGPGARRLGLATDPQLDPGVLEALKRFDTPTLANAIETFDIRPRDEGYMSMEIRCLFPELGPMVGYAVTGTIRARGSSRGDQTALYQHVRQVPGPRIAVVQDLDEPPGRGSLWG